MARIYVDTSELRRLIGPIEGALEALSEVNLALVRGWFRTLPPPVELLGLEAHCALVQAELTALGAELALEIPALLAEASQLELEEAAGGLASRLLADTRSAWDGVDWSTEAMPALTAALEGVAELTALVVDGDPDAGGLLQEVSDVEGVGPASSDWLKVIHIGGELISTVRTAASATKASADGSPLPIPFASLVSLGLDGITLEHDIHAPGMSTSVRRFHVGLDSANMAADALMAVPVPQVELAGVVVKGAVIATEAGELVYDHRQAIEADEAKAVSFVGGQWTQSIDTVDHAGHAVLSRLKSWV